MMVGLVGASLVENFDVVVYHTNLMVVASQEEEEVNPKGRGGKGPFKLGPIHPVVQDFDQMEEVEWKIDEELELVVEFVQIVFDSVVFYFDSCLMMVTVFLPYLFIKKTLNKISPIKITLMKNYRSTFSCWIRKRFECWTSVVILK